MFQVKAIIVPYRFVKVRFDELDDMINHRDFFRLTTERTTANAHTAVCLFPIGERRPSPHTSVEAHGRVLANTRRSSPCLNASNVVRLTSSFPASVMSQCPSIEAKRRQNVEDNRRFLAELKINHVSAMSVRSLGARKTELEFDLLTRFVLHGSVSR